jgi:hypothetical protein
MGKGLAGDVRLDALKAAAVSIPFIREVERRIPARQGVALELLRSQLQVVIVTTEAHEGSLAAFLRDAARLFQGGLAAGLDDRLSEADREYAARLLEELESRASQDPHGEAAALTGAEVEGSAAACVPEIGEAFDFAEALVTDLLQGAGLPTPTILRRLSAGEQLRATCKHADALPDRADLVTIVLPSGGFAENDLHVMPYLISHEVICHAAQGLAGPGERSPSGRACAWSDGWMDRLAFEETLDRLFGGRLPKGWISQSGSFAAEAATAAHTLRDQTSALTKREETDLRARRQATTAWRQLREAAIAQGLSEAGAEDLRRAFSLRLNAQNLSYQVRERLMSGLWCALQTPQDHAKTINAAHKFAVGGDVSELQEALDI